MQENTCYLCGALIREDQIMVTRIPIWATATENDPNQWKNTDVAMAFMNNEGEFVPLCMNCALDATMRCWHRIQSL
ncbi:MAG: hypothetical protein OEV25_10130 [Deltaproteobacteria bacterium]|nr:hypothetical protein [Deltaproteobacteria bacterium]